MRVLHLLPIVRDIGNGIVNVTVDLMLEQAAQGMSVAVASQGGEFEPLLAEHGIRHHRLRISPRPPRDLPRTAWALHQTVKREAPDIIHAHTAAGTLLARAATRRPLVATAHNAFNLQSVLPMELASRMITISQADDWSIGAWSGARNRRLVRHGVIGSRRPSGPPVELSHPAIVCASGFYPWKGISDLIEAMRLVVMQGPDHATLYLVGDGPQRSQLEAEVAAAHLDRNIKFVGFKPNPRSYMEAADVFVLPSREEGFGLALAEARAAGCAIVATDVGGVGEVLEQGTRGRLVPKASPGALAAALIDFVIDDPKRVALAAAAQENTDWLTVARMEREVRAVYESLTT